jgi:hypothetical protein
MSLPCDTCRNAYMHARSQLTPASNNTGSNGNLAYYQQLSMQPHNQYLNPNSIAAKSQ